MFLLVYVSRRQASSSAIKDMSLCPEASKVHIAKTQAFQHKQEQRHVLQRCCHTTGNSDQPKNKIQDQDSYGCVIYSRSKDKKKLQLKEFVYVKKKVVEDQESSFVLRIK